MIFIVIGLPATGKSYFARHVADEIGAVHLNTDIIRKKINKQGQYDDQSKELVYDHLLKEMNQHARSNDHVIVDGTFHKKTQRERFAREARNHSQEIYFVEMRATESTVKERLRSDRANSEADFNVYKQIKNTFDHMKKPHLILWTDENDVAELIQKLKTHIHGANE